MAWISQSILAPAIAASGAATADRAAGDRTTAQNDEGRHDGGLPVQDAATIALRELLALARLVEADLALHFAGIACDEARLDSGLERRVVVDARVMPCRTAWPGRIRRRLRR
jgi:hypothetical protein